MGRRRSYEPGTFCWVDLGTTDVEGAKAFYNELLGWDYNDRPAGADIYSVARRYEADVAALYGQRANERRRGLPPHWDSYVSTDSADRTAAQAKELGGSVLAEPFDVMDAGRMAVIADPTGAMLCAWQPADHIGAGHVNDVGCLTWNELSTSDPERAAAFYSELFGWRFEEVDAAGGPAYWVIGHNGAAEGRNGGMRELAPEQVQARIPPHWMPYFTVDSVEDTGQKVTTARGTLLAGPMQIGVGRIAVMSDPQGAVFAVFEGEVDE